MVLRTLVMAMAFLLPSDGWADQLPRGGSVGALCADGLNPFEYAVYFSGQRHGAKLLGFDLVTCPAAASVLVFGVDDPSLDLTGDNVLQLAVVGGTTVTYDESLEILETIGLLRSRAWTGKWAIGGSAHLSNDVCSGPVVDYVLRPDLTVVPREEFCQPLQAL